MSEENQDPNKGKGKEGGEQPPDKTELYNEAFGKGAARAREEFLASLGVKNVEEAKKVLDSAKAAAEEKAKAEGKLGEFLESEKKRSADLESQIQKLQEQNRQQALKNAFFAKASGKVVDVDAAFRLADLSKVKFNGEEIDGIDTIVEDLVKSKPYLAHDPKSTPKGGGSNPAGGGNLPTNIKDLTPEEFAKLQQRVSNGEVIQLTK